MDKGNIAEYSQALLDCSFPRRRIAACPLAFGEVGVKERVKSVLNYKKPAFWIITVAVAVCFVIGVCFMTNPYSDNKIDDKMKTTLDTAIADHNKSASNDGAYDEAYKKNELLDIAKLKEIYPEFFNISTDGGLTVYVWQMAKDDYRCYLTNKSIDALTDQSFLFEKGARLSEMKVILSSYGLKKENVDIQLITNSISSYFPDWEIIEQGEDKNEKIDSYTNRIREMLFNQ